MAAGPADKELDTFKTLVWNVLVSVATQVAIAAIPFASWGFFSFLSGPLGFLIGQVIGWLSNILYNLLKDTVNLSVIMLTNEVHHAAYVKASQDLQDAWNKYGGNSKEFQDARDLHVKALAAFVKWNNS
jgi:hypothetical protein